ncbi:MAG TPA: hypothetical protein VK530_13070 [Candidatus Acidoferrum sp.]|nr:hypothetical protein [Candidatus Acidoferrum sp.]
MKTRNALFMAKRNHKFPHLTRAAAQKVSLYWRAMRSSEPESMQLNKPKARRHEVETFLLAFVSSWFMLARALMERVEVDVERASCGLASLDPRAKHPAHA